MLDDFLGVRKYKPETIAQGCEVGIANGLAWTTTGGSVLEVEVNVLKGSGKLELTGNLGDIMKESAQAAVSYIRSRAEKLSISPKFYKTHDIHIHFPEGAIPKDGPSAGITICIAAISALSGIPVRREIAMTGEITLRGRLLRIGGLKEKTMAALRAGVKTVILPTENEPDLEDLDQVIRRDLNFVTTDNVDDILNVVLDFSAVDKEDALTQVPPLIGEEQPLPSTGTALKH
jgi:ATP-dependent Lon protease